MSVHLDEGRWAAMLAGRLAPAEEAHLTRHLDDDCEVCDAFLAARTELDPLDGAVDALLLDLAPGADPRAATDEVGFERFHRAAVADTGGRRRLSRRRSTLGALGALGAVAATVAVLVAGPPSGPEPGPVFREKGGAPAAAPGLRVEAFLAPEDGAPVPLGRDGHVPAGTAVAIRVVVDRATCVHLWWDRPRVERLTNAPLCLGPGAHVLARDGQALGLRPERPGALTLWVVPEAAEVAGDPARALAAGELPQGSARISLQVRARGP